MDAKIQISGKGIAKAVGLILSPRRNVPYNCSLTSYQGKLYINFIRRSGKAVLERI